MSEKLRQLLTGPRSIRWSIFRSFLLLIVGLSAVLLATTFFGATRVVEQLSRELIERTADQVHEKLTRFLRPVENDLIVVRDMGEAGLFDPNSEAEMNSTLLSPTPKTGS